MTKRRTHGDGSVYYEAERDRWVGSIDLGRDPLTGKRRRAKVTGATRKDATDRMRERRAAIAAGDTAPATMTVADLLDMFAEAVVPTMTPNTASDTTAHLKAAAAGLGAVRLVDLRAHHVETWLRARAEQPGRGGRTLSRSVVSRDRATLARVLRWGQRRELVARNAAELAEMPPTPAPKAGRALTGEELRRLLAEADGTRLEALWWVMAGLGLRPGEAAGLSWSDVDLDAGVIHVRQARKERAGALELGEVKTARSRRSIGIPPPVVDRLRAHRRRWTEERLMLGATWPAKWQDLVFITEAGTPVDPANLRRELARLTKAAKLGALRPYDLRHTAASLIAERGARLEDVADVLGHAGTHLARAVYIHATTSTVAHAVAPMTAVLTGEDTEGSQPGSQTTADAPGHAPAVGDN